MCCATAEGTTCSFTVITTDKKKADMQRYIIMVIIPSVTTSKAILFYAEISTFEKTLLFILELSL
jgi:hypothetical protein